MAPRKHRNRITANREANRLARAIPHARVEVEDGNEVKVYAYRIAMTPEQLKAAEGYTIHPPAKPSPEHPLLPPPKPRKKARLGPRSKVRNARKVCYNLYAQLYAEGNLIPRKAAIAKAVALGVVEGTAAYNHTQFCHVVGFRSSTGQASVYRPPPPFDANGPPLDPQPRNGISVPKIGTFSREVWDLCEEIWIDTGLTPRPKEVKDVLSLVVHEGVIKKTMRRWRIYNNVAPCGPVRR